MKTLIYQDNVSSNGALYTALSKLKGAANVFFVNANEIIGGVLDDTVELFVMPGGAARYKAAKLNGAGYNQIRKYVEQGGSYLGICAGAYSACETTDWARGTAFEIQTSNELVLFPGRAVGPVNDFGAADSYNGSGARLVELDFDAFSARSLYWGGCRFVPNETAAAVVVARFSNLPDKPPAIVAGRYGSGRWLLSSTHIEYDHEALELINFDVVGNDFEDIKTLGDWSDLNLNALELLINRYLHSTNDQLR